MNCSVRSRKGLRKSPIRAVVALAFLQIIFSGCNRAPDEEQTQRRPVNVIVAPVEKKSVSENIDLVGSLSPNEKVELESEINGVISGIYFQEGDWVKKGQPLIELDDSKLMARVAVAEANFRLAETNRSRSRNLLDTNTISEQAYDQSVSEYEVGAATLELRKRELQDASIAAPFDGVVGLRRVSPGQFIQPGQILTVLVSIDPIKADFQVPERFIGVLRIGQEINIRVAAYVDESFKGNVYFISPEVDQTTRNVLVRATIENRQMRLKPGMFGNLSLLLQIREHAMVIPESALIVQADQSFVMSVAEDNTAHMNMVTAGLRLEGEVEILEGLNVGDRVITEGHQKLGPGTPVNPLGRETGEAY